jgi:hypothetical protein
MSSPYFKRQLSLSSGYVTLEYTGNLFELNVRDRRLVSSLTDMFDDYEKEMAHPTPQPKAARVVTQSEPPAPEIATASPEDAIADR